MFRLYYTHFTQTPHHALFLVFRLITYTIFKVNFGTINQYCVTKSLRTVI